MESPAALDLTTRRPQRLHQALGLLLRRAQSLEEGSEEGEDDQASCHLRTGLYPHQAEERTIDTQVQSLKEYAKQQGYRLEERQQLVRLLVEEVEVAGTEVQIKHIVPLTCLH